MASVVAALDDLFFGAKLEETARRLGVELILVPSAQGVAAAVRRHRPALVIMDLQAEACRPIETIREMKADPELKAAPILGFFAHVRADLKAAAAEAGCDELLPRSAFSARLPEILKRFAPVAEGGGTSDAPSGARP